MSQELSKSLYCIQMRSGIEIWVEQERARKLQTILQSLNQHMFIKFEDKTINTADLVGVFSALDMEDLTRRKNGQWKCKEEKWHDKRENCTCLSQDQKRNAETWREQWKEKYGVEPLI